MKKWILIGIIFIVGIFAVFTESLEMRFRDFFLSGLSKEFLDSTEIGKPLTIYIHEDMIVDASFIDKVNKGEIELEPGEQFKRPFFDMIKNEECDKLINYMADNQLVIEPRLYTINQAWSADKIIETLRFKKQDNKQKIRTIYFNWNCLDEFREYCNKGKIFIYKRTLNVFDTIIHDCNCYDSLVVEDINLNIRIGDTAGFPGRCLDGRITSSGWLLTDTDTLCWACSSFFLKKGKDYYDVIADSTSSLRFKDILNSVEDSLRGEKRKRNISKKHRL